MSSPLPSALPFALPEHSLVLLRHELPGATRAFPAGSPGAIVHVHAAGAAYEVELSARGPEDAESEVLTVERAQLDLGWRPSAPTQRSRIIGCLVGGAIGDALGGPCEGRTPPADLDTRALRVSDDTQLTLATCESIREQKRVVPEAIAQRFGKLFAASRLRGLGASTYKALSELALGGHWALVGAKGERSAGNGAAMRAAPLAFVLDPADSFARQTLRDVSRITHHNDEAQTGALAFVLALRAAWTGAWRGRGDLLERVADRLPDTRVRDRLRELGSLRALPLEDLAQRFGASGYVVDSVPLALCAAERVADYGVFGTLRSLVSLGVHLGPGREADSDTLASLAGQLLGAVLGVESLPADVWERIEDRATLLESAFRFADACSIDLG